MDAAVDAIAPLDAEAGLDAAPDAGQADATDLSCSFLSGGLTSASSSGASCERKDVYACPGGTQTVTCDCPLATCTCTDGGTVPFSCDGGGCKIGDAQRAACGFSADGGS